MIRKKKIPSVFITIIAWVVGMGMSIPISVYFILPNTVTPLNFILIIEVTLFIGYISWSLVYYFYDLIYKYHMK